MTAWDQFRFGLTALTGARARTGLMLLAMSIGVASVVLLTALGEGARRYVVGQFSNLGTHLVIMLPGRSETTGGAPPLMGETPRDLTLQDALAVARHPSVRRIAPIIVGNAPVSHGGLEREVTIIGTNADFFPVRQLSVASGKPLPPGDITRASQVVILGGKLQQELFKTERALGQWVRIGDRRFRVIGTLAEEGESLGQDLGDMAIIPVAAAQALFNRQGLFRLLLQARNRESVAKVKQAARAIIRERHHGEDDVTLITQDALLGTFDTILRTLTYAVGGIAAISLSVAGILIMNVMLVTVSQRTAEIGLLKALGAPRGEILRLFLVESTLLASLGAVIGLLLAWGGILVLRQLLDFPLAAPAWAPIAAAGVAFITGILFGLMPARRAASLDPVVALAGQ